MGADFIFAITKVCTNPNQAKRAVGNLSYDILAEISEALWGDLPEPEDLEALQDVRDTLFSAIDLVVDPDRRDQSFIHIAEPGEYVISGGMSWGDSPTESFDPMMALQMSGLEYD